MMRLSSAGDAVSAPALAEDCTQQGRNFMSAILPKISYPVPSNRNGTAFSSAEDLLAVLGGES